MFGKKEAYVDFEIFTIYDSKSQSYGVPVLEKNHLVMIREITNTLSKPEQQAQNALYINAEDFSVFRIGTFDKKTGLLTTQNLEHIVNLQDLRSLVDRESTSRNTEMGIVRT